MALCGLVLGMLRVSQRQLPTCFRPALPACTQYFRGLSYNTSGPPKKPFNSFLLFTQERRTEIRMRNPEMKMTDVTKLLGAEWRQMSDADKQPFIEQAATESAKWAKVNALYMESLTEGEKIQLKVKKKERLGVLQKFRRKKMQKKLDKPKKPGSPFLLFCNDPKIADRGEAQMVDFVKGMAERWKRMAVEDKQPYVDEAAQLKTEYDKQLNIWEMQMLDEGHPELVRLASLPKVPKPRQKKVKKAANKKVVKKSKPKSKKTTKSASAKSKTSKKGEKSTKSVSTQTEDVSWMREE